MEKIIAIGNVANILSAFYCQPEDGIFLDSNLHTLLVENAKSISPQLETLASQLINSISEYDNLTLLREYTRIFLGPFEIIAHPYASVYLDNYHLNGETTEKILHFYNECGLLFDEQVNDLPDNIVPVLQFLYYLVKSYVSGNQDFPNIDWIQKIGLFTDLYMKTWIPLMCEKILQGTENNFYKNLALFTKKFLEEMN
ncbi:MAG: Cytoplasmic chaperone TorD [Candidatus Kapaibacterium sp.]|nr:MAG: Cytoplasmic chaperone TorD [Candidatus Kapabacteria bacterium]